MDCKKAVKKLRRQFTLMDSIRFSSISMPLKGAENAVERAYQRGLDKAEKVLESAISELQQSAPSGFRQ